MTFGQILRAPLEWLTRGAALRDARAVLAGVDERRAAAARQAALLREVAARTSTSPVLAPPAARQAVALSLDRQAADWARVATAIDADANAQADALDALDAPRRRIARLLIQRWSRLALVAAVLLLAAIAVRIRTLGPDLAAGRPLRTSTVWSGWQKCITTSRCNGLMFHTENEFFPWVEIDLGAPRTVRRVEVWNRDNCCAERATPLAAEVSDDRATWSEVARRTVDFGKWTAVFPPRTARFVRLRVLKRSVLHLQRIAVR